MNGRRIVGLLMVLVLLATGSGRCESTLPSDWHEVLTKASRLTDPGERIVRISERFLDTPYRAQTLVGSADTPEQLTIRLDAVDCFTLLDYVEALRRTGDPGEFRNRLIEVRYRDGIIAWNQRRHFFTDWAAAPGGRLVDVTAEVGGDRARQAAKVLNRKVDGSRYLAGVAEQERPVRFIPTQRLDAKVLGRLHPGDYLGIYTDQAGLDVSHVGIVVRKDGRLWLRHASSRREVGRVVDSDLSAYLAGKPGIVILRPQ
ncbi:MAG: DUF1460 domain-containing protein [Desulfuromonas sp.]|nr:DUF1460 domain-containing protein [Desulfuromonas sp.]